MPRVALCTDISSSLVAAVVVVGCAVKIGSLLVAPDILVGSESSSAKDVVVVVVMVEGVDLHVKTCFS